MMRLFYALLITLIIFPTDVFSRGSVRGANRSGSGGSWSGARTSGTTQRNVSGNTASRNTSGQTRSGESFSGNKNVSKSGDTVTVDKTKQTSTGASKSTSKEYEFDDGQLDSVERQTSATNRHGQSAEWQGKAEKEGAGWQFEGEGTNRYGQKTEVEGYGARGPYGTGVVADVEGGRYGDRTVVAGKPYGGATWTASLPYGSRPYTYHGNPYYYHGGAYYRPYYHAGVPYYCYVRPPYGVYYSDPPVGAIMLTVAAVTLLYAEGTYYKKSTTAQGTTTYVVVAPPAGTSLQGTALPADRATVTISGTTYFLYGNTFYKRVVTDGKESFVVITRPAGVITVKAVPPEFEPVQAGSLTYFKTKDRFYLTYLDPSGEELYVVVDPPSAQYTAASAKLQSTKQPPQTSTPQTLNLTVARGTVFKIRLAADVNSASVTGQNFRANLAQDIIVDGRLIAPKSSPAIGTVWYSNGILTVQLTDLEVGGRLYPVSTDKLQTAKSSQTATTLPAVVDPAQKTSTALLAAGTPLDFRVSQPFTVAVLVSSGTAK